MKNVINLSLLTLLVFAIFISVSDAASGDVDSDGDGLIEISTIEQLNNIRYNLSGSSYKTSAADSGLSSGCPITSITRINGSSGTGCYGYELTKSIDFNSPSSYTSNNVDTSYTTGSG
ncbi:MAG: hypothetical protein ORN26_00540 [Candidatus Pacebacteria bacterium]|nr:hypothetical protein [Candidatus Paceibacterota bacterium]